MRTVTLPVKGLNFAGCAREIEKNLGYGANQQVEASYVSQTATITYDESMLARHNYGRWSRIVALPVENLSPNSRTNRHCFTANRSC